LRLLYTGLESVLPLPVVSHTFVQSIQLDVAAELDNNRQTSNLSFADICFCCRHCI